MATAWKVWLCLLAIFIVVLVGFGQPNATVRALPEYSAQVGEPCATCHVSPSGGGPRGPRGTAWVASSKPGAVPDLLQALEILGVRLTVDPLEYRAVTQEIDPAAAPEKTSIPSAELLEYLRDYEGN